MRVFPLAASKLNSLSYKLRASQDYFINLNHKFLVNCPLRSSLSPVFSLLSLPPFACGFLLNVDLPKATNPTEASFKRF